MPSNMPSAYLPITSPSSLPIRPGGCPGLTLGSRTLRGPLRNCFVTLRASFEWITSSLGNLFSAKLPAKRLKLLSFCPVSVRNWAETGQMCQKLGVKQGFNDVNLEMDAACQLFGASGRGANCRSEIIAPGRVCGWHRPSSYTHG